MSTNTDLEPSQIIAYFVRRWQIEVTFAETRAHLRVETQRQWNDNAIIRTTPSLLALYSLVTVWAGEVLGQTNRPYAAAWYKKQNSHSQMRSVQSASFCEAKIFIDTARQTRKCIKYLQDGLYVWRRRYASPHNVQSRA